MQAVDGGEYAILYPKRRHVIVAAPMMMAPDIMAPPVAQCIGRQQRRFAG